MSKIYGISGAILHRVQSFLSPWMDLNFKHLSSRDTVESNNMADFDNLSKYSRVNWDYGLMYQSIPRLTIPPSNFFDGRIPHPLAKKEFKPHPQGL